jgi:hypothetical protein
VFVAGVFRFQCPGRHRVWFEVSCSHRRRSPVYDRGCISARRLTTPTALKMHAQTNYWPASCEVDGGAVLHNAA